MGVPLILPHVTPECFYRGSVTDFRQKHSGMTGYYKRYNVENKNYKEVEDANEISRLLKVISEKAPHIKNIIIEDSNYIMGFNMVSKATETGFTKFSVMAKDMVDLFRTARQLRDDITVFYLTHPEEIMDGTDVIGYKIKTAGKLIDNQVLLEGLLTVCLYTHVEENKDGSANYQFLTNRYRKYPAKSPDGMFPEVKIPNNLQVVADSLTNYYNA